jgi:hypothetical protein
VHDGLDQQALCIDEDMALLALDLLAFDLLALDLLAGVVARRTGDPPFSALLTLCESITAAVGLVSRSSA